MVYRVMGLMSGSSLDGLDLALVELQHSAGNWKYSVMEAECIPYSGNWVSRLQKATQLSALDYLLLHTEYGHYTGELVNDFIRRKGLQYQVQLIASHGHTTFHMPGKKMTAQLGDGAAIAAVTGINVVSDLRAMNVALGGEGAPIVPIGEKLLFNQYRYFLNLGGIANISLNQPDEYIAFDVCPANRVLNMLANEAGKSYDDGGRMAAKGNIQPVMLGLLNDLEYYSMPYPKSLANDFGTDVVYRLIKACKDSVEDSLRTFIEHIGMQVVRSVKLLQEKFPPEENQQMLLTGGGAHNTFLTERLRAGLAQLNIELVVPDSQMVDFKEAVVMALIGLLRWREENNVLASVTGASRDSIGGAVWIGQDA